MPYDRTRSTQPTTVPVSFQFWAVELRAFNLWGAEITTTPQATACHFADISRL